MSSYEIFYFFLITIGITLSFVALYQGHKRYFPVLLVLLLTLITELIVTQTIYKQPKIVFLYHVFTAVEYSLFSWYLSQTPPLARFGKYILYSIPPVVIILCLISNFYYHYMDFPGINLNITGILLFSMCTTLLFNLDASEEGSIFRNTDVWIAFGLLAFEGGTFFYNGIYTKLVNMDQEKAMRLFGMLFKPLNIIMYTSINIGLLCLILRKKSITR